jgi:hypothetical protein
MEVADWLTELNEDMTDSEIGWLIFEGDLTPPEGIKVDIDLGVFCITIKLSDAWESYRIKM